MEKIINFATRTDTTFITANGKTAFLQDFLEGVDKALQGHARRLLRLMKARVKDYLSLEDLEDLAMKASEKIWEKRDTLTPNSVADCFKYGYVAMQNMVVDAYRHGKVAKTDHFSDLWDEKSGDELEDTIKMVASAVYNADTKVLTEEAESLLDEGIGSLGETYRKVMALNRYGFTSREIGEILGFGAKDSYTKLSKAKASLKERLGADTLREYGICA